jgi:tetratricopeptide (TPR) repeat protein
MADAYRVLGMLLARQSGRDGKADPDARERAIAMLKNGLAALDKSAEQTDFNLIYLYRAQIERELAGLLPEEGYDRQYPRNLEEVIVHYTPAMYEIAYELAEALAAQPQPDVQRIVRLRRHVRQVMPSFFDLHYVFKAYGYLSEQRYETAARAWEQVLQVDPLNVEWLGATATAEFYAGDTARAAELLAVLRRADPNPTPGNESRLLEASLRRDWGAMRKELGRMSSDDPRARARLRALEMLVEERLGVPADDPVWFERPDVVEPGAWERLLGEERPGALHYFARDPAAARQAAQERLALEGPGPPISFWIETIRVGLAAGDEALARRAYEAVRGAQGDHPALDELAGRLGLPASR